MVSSKKQKLVAKSSTKGELVGGGNYMPFGVWMKKFLEGQGIGVKKFDFNQDNMATMSIEEKKDRPQLPHKYSAMWTFLISS